MGTHQHITATQGCDGAPGLHFAQQKRRSGQFERDLDEVIRTSSRDSAMHSVYYINVDRFRIVNELCGYDGGDACLNLIAGQLRRSVEGHGLVVHLGGDSFAALVGGLSACVAEEKARDLVKALKPLRFRHDHMSLRVSASVGVVHVTEAATSGAQLLRDAETACRQAKESGRNRIHAASDEDPILRERGDDMDWIWRVGDALDRDGFELYFQPIRAVSRIEPWEQFEVLLRMRDLDGRTVAPAAFLGVAERFGLAVEIDRWVIARSLSALAAIRATNGRAIRLNINLSGSSLGDDDLLSFIVGELTRLGIPGSSVCFEITETAAVLDMDQASRFMARLKSLGCQFALDDFGTGASSLAYLNELDVDFLKVDGVFIREIANNRNGSAILTHIQALARTLGMQTIAECIESAQVHARVCGVPVDYVQGYWLGPPMPLASI